MSPRLLDPGRGPGMGEGGETKGEKKGAMGILRYSHRLKGGSGRGAGRLLSRKKRRNCLPLGGRGKGEGKKRGGYANSSSNL